MKNTVLITGASGDIGGAIAAAFATTGYKVALGCHSHPDKARNLSNELNAKGCQTMVCGGDVADATAVDLMFRQVEARFGEVGVLVNNAGIAQQKLFCDISDDEWQQMMAVHVTGTFNCCRRALPAMIREKSGAIVNVVSMWGQVGASCEVHYSAAKGAVIGLTKALAKEMGPSGIRVNAVSPGVIDTAMMAAFSPEDKQALCEETPLGILGIPDDVAGPVLFLASDAARFITGQVLAPNGGMVV